MKPNFILFLIAYILLLPLTVFNYTVVIRDKSRSRKGYFLSTAVNLDKFANREFRATWNKYLKTENGYEFGNPNETISSALGKNKRNKTLSRLGIRLANFLDRLDENHCIKSINREI